MKKSILPIVLLTIMWNFLSAQDNNIARSIAQQIDSVYKANNIKKCNVYFRTGANTPDYKTQESNVTNFKLVNNFLIVDDRNFYNLAKIIHYTLNIKNKPNKNEIDFYFQGF